MRESKAINIEIGKNIKAERERARYTQEQLAELIHLTRNQLSAIERGVSGTSFEVIKSLCSVLNISSDLLLFGRPQPDNFTLELTNKLFEIDPRYRPQIYKILYVLQETLTMKEAEKSDDTP